MASSSTIVFVSDKQSGDTGPRTSWIWCTNQFHRYNWFIMANDAVTFIVITRGTKYHCKAASWYFSALVSLRCSCQCQGILWTIFWCFHRQDWKYQNSCTSVKIFLLLEIIAKLEKACLSEIIMILKKLSSYYEYRSHIQ